MKTIANIQAFIEKGKFQQLEGTYESFLEMNFLKEKTQNKDLQFLVIFHNA